MGKKITVLVSPPGGGKSTLAKEYLEKGYTYINQDSQSKGHMDLFKQTIIAGADVIVDRLNFSKEQRNRYLNPAKEAGYVTEIVVLHQPYSVCFQRCMERQDHETIKDEKNARAALNMFFTKYERVEDSEADVVQRIWPETTKPVAIWSDLDGTLCNVEHRRHFVKKPKGEKKNWLGFFKSMSEDTVNQPVMDVLLKFPNVIYCSGRPDSYKKETQDWLLKHQAPNGPLFMRNRQDSRPDFIVKEILLDFEVLTRFSINFCLDDRDQVVKMLRDRGFTVFQVAEGDF